MTQKTNHKTAQQTAWVGVVLFVIGVALLVEVSQQWYATPQKPPLYDFATACALLLCSAFWVADSRKALRHDGERTPTRALATGGLFLLLHLCKPRPHTHLDVYLAFLAAGLFAAIFAGGLAATIVLMRLRVWRSRRARL